MTPHLIAALSPIVVAFGDMDGRGWRGFQVIGSIASALGGLVFFAIIAAVLYFLLRFLIIGTKAAQVYLDKNSPAGGTSGGPSSGPSHGHTDAGGPAPATHEPSAPHDSPDVHAPAAPHDPPAADSPAFSDWASPAADAPNTPLAPMVPPKAPRAPRTPRPPRPAKPSE